MPDMPQDSFMPGQSHAVRSLCMYCHEEGDTKFMLTKIPFYKEVMISSFVCDSCHFHDTSVTSATGLAEKTVKYTLKVDPIMCEYDEVQKDLSRTIVRTESAIISIPELGFEIPANRAEINTVEGLLLNISESLLAGQEQRKVDDPDNYEKLSILIEKFQIMRDGQEEFTLVIYDPAGNAFLSNPYAPSTDPRCSITYSERTNDELIAMGYSEDDIQRHRNEQQAAFDNEKDRLLTQAMHELRLRENDIIKKQNSINGSVMKLSSERGDGYKSGGSKSGLKIMSSQMLNKKDLDKFEHLSDQAQQTTARFPGLCPSCHTPNETRMCLIDVPYFGTTIIMCTDCTHCHYKSTEVKNGCGIAEKGVKITLHVKNAEDLSRDMLKSEESSIHIPEIGLDLNPGTLGGRFTSIEGILSAIKDHIEPNKAFYLGDSAFKDQAVRVNEFFNDLEAMIQGTKPFTLIINDPIGGSFIEGRVDGVHDTSPFEDPALQIEYFTRTEEQDDMLGIKDMVTEGYYDPKLDAKDSDSDENDDDTDDDDDDDDDEDDTDDEADEEEKDETAQQ